VNVPRALRLAGRGFDFIVVAVNFLASAMIFALMLLMVADVAMRSLLNSPITGVNEMMEIAIVVMLYMQVTQALKENRHTRSDAFFTTMSRRSPAAGKALTVLFSVAGFALMAAVVWVGIPGIREAFVSNYTIGTHGVFIVPEWPVRAAIVFGCTLMAVQFGITAVGAFVALVSGRETAPSRSEGAQDAWV
jgi:TRAP-type mannitol/chloroaromatic compound transport system permease small subunit